MPGAEETVARVRAEAEAERAYSVKISESASPTPTRGADPIIDDRMSRLAAEVDQLAFVIDRLGDKISAVLAPDQPVEPNVVPERPSWSVLSIAIDAQADRVNAQRARIAYLCDRIEL